MLTLRPVTFSYKSDPKNTKQYGLIAEEANEVYPEIVIRDEAGEIYSVNYMALIPLLLKQIQELEAHNQAQDARVDQQQDQIDEMKKLVSQLMSLINLPN